MAVICQAKHSLGGMVLDNQGVTGYVERIEWSADGFMYLVRYPGDRGGIGYTEDELDKKAPVYPKYGPGDPVVVHLGGKYYECVIMYVCRLGEDKVPIYRCRLSGRPEVLPPGVNPDARLMVRETDLYVEAPTGAGAEVRVKAEEPAEERHYNDGDKVWTWDIAIPVPIPCVVKVSYAMGTSTRKYDLVTESEYRGMWEKGQQIDDAPVDEIYDSFDSAYLDLQSSRHQAGLSLMSEAINHLDTIRSDLEKARDTLR